MQNSLAMSLSKGNSLHNRIWRKVTRYYTKLARDEKMLDGLRADAKLKLHLGCGNKYQQGYVNVDAYSDLADVKADILALEPFEDGSVDLIETHHVLEHLSFGESEAALAEWARKLKLGGHVIISVPDVNACCQLWFDTPEPERWGSGSISQMIFGSQEHAGMFHKSGYTPERLSALLVVKGLTIKRVLLGYPERPTPTFLVLAQKTDGL